MSPLTSAFAQQELTNDLDLNLELQQRLRRHKDVVFIDLFFLPHDLRGGGLGSRLLGLAEDEARKRGCVSAVLYTFNFQAPGFYERHGYRVLGTIDCLPPGTSRIFMTKRLA